MASTKLPRGRDAQGPHEIPLRGWRDISARLRQRLASDRITLVAAGVAFYTMLSLFPALGAFVSLYGLIADPARLSDRLLKLGELLPTEARQIVEQQLTDLATSPGPSLGTGLAIGILLSLWSARRGMAAMVSALNIAYGEEEQRGFLHQQLLSVLLVLGALLLGGVAIGLVVVLPLLARVVGIDDWFPASMLARWPILAVLFLFALSVLYRFGPCRRSARWQWIGWGSGIATILWLGACVVFSYLTSTFDRFAESYGAVSGIVVLLLWLYLSALVVLFGAELNAEMEHQTRQDTTVGGEQPMGERGARVADTLGPARGERDGGPGPDSG